jgi:hypothetical protein
MHKSLQKPRRNVRSKSFANVNLRRSGRGRRSSLGIKTLTLKSSSAKMQMTGNGLSSLSNSPVYARTVIAAAAAGDAHDWDEEKASPEKNRLREELKKMKIVSRAKVTQDRIYSMAYHPEPVSCVDFLPSRV